MARLRTPPYSKKCDSCGRRVLWDELVHCHEDGQDYHYCEDCYAP